MQDNYKIEKIDYQEIGKIVRITSICFNKVKDMDLLKWKYFDNPAGEALCLAVKNGDTIAGSCVMIPEEFYVFGKKRRIYKCCDLMVHPDHRKQGLATRLILYLGEHLKRRGPLFLYTLCSKNATPAFLKNKWIRLGDVNNYFKHRFQFTSKFLFNRFDRLYSEGTLRYIDSISDFCKAYRFKIDETKIHIVKNEDYFNWRLRDPRYKYKIVGYYERDNLKGYVIYNTGIGNNAYIVDLEVDNDSPKVISTLLTAVELAAFQASNKMIITLTINDTIFHDIIRKNGYIRNPFCKGSLTSTIDFNILVEGGDNKKAFNRPSWDIFSLNYDGV
jgi:GNAT superfamily N-acetyltransferase